MVSTPGAFSAFVKVHVTVASEAAWTPVTVLSPGVPLFVPPAHDADVNVQSDDGRVSLTVVAVALLIGTVKELSTLAVLPFTFPLNVVPPETVNAKSVVVSPPAFLTIFRNASRGMSTQSDGSDPGDCDGYEHVFTSRDAVAPPTSARETWQMAVVSC